MAASRDNSSGSGGGIIIGMVVKKGQAEGARLLGGFVPNCRQSLELYWCCRRDEEAKRRRGEEN